MLSFHHFNEISQKIEQIQTMQGIEQHEKSLRDLEIKLVNNNGHLIKNAAQELYDLLIKSSKIPLNNKFTEKLPGDLTDKYLACIQRYIYVPLFYKLGYTQEAAELSQETFKYLFPLLHDCMEKKVNELLGPNVGQRIKKITEQFALTNSLIKKIYSRPKSIHSIWKKLSFAMLKNMSASKFKEIINDYLGIRWNMTIKPEQNEYDALINSVNLMPKQNILHFRNQQLPQENGFSGESIFKFLYLIDDIPVEAQALADELELFMCAHGYSLYKTGAEFLQPKDLSEIEKKARLGLCLFYGKNRFAEKFRELMLNELLSKAIYTKEYIFSVAKEPLDKTNLLLCFAKNQKPVYQTANLEFVSEQMNLFLITKQEKITQEAEVTNRPGQRF